MSSFRETVKTITANYVDPFILALIALLLLGIFVPVPEQAITVLGETGRWAVVLLFFVYGSRLTTREVWNGLKNLKLQGAIAAATFVIFPLLGAVSHPLAIKLMGPIFAAGLLYFTLLPSTVQSSVSYTNIAGGNVPGAVCAATISNVSGMIISPLLVILIMGQSAGVHLSSIKDVALKLLLPFALGQLIQPFVGNWVRKQKWLTKIVDRGTILVVAGASVFGATARGLWDDIAVSSVFVLAAVCLVLLGIMLATTWWGGKLIGLDRADRIALMMCGSKKSMATGLPMAAIIFPPEMVAHVTVPVILFHLLQLIVAAFLARRMAVTNASDSTW